MIDVILKKAKRRLYCTATPWVFSGAIEKVKGKPANGDVVRLLNAKALLWPMVFITISRAWQYAFAGVGRRC
jgi:23S rRNA G2069 N7-methylase RlmK/C1962 C5-methylase RlmI